MKNLVIFSAAIVMLLCSASGAKAAIIDFNTGADANISTYSQPSAPAFVFTRTTVSGDMSINASFNPFTSDFLRYQEPAVVTLTASGGAFDLSTLKYAGANSGDVFQVIGIFNDVGPLIQSYSFSTNGTLEDFDFNWTNLSSVVFSTSAGGDIGLDDLNVELYSAPAAVPEPASAAFLGLGSLALVVRRLRRRTSVVA